MPIIIPPEFDKDTSRLSENQGSDTPEVLRRRITEDNIFDPSHHYNGSLALQDSTESVNKKPPCIHWGTRHTFSLLAFLGFANIYAMRVNLSVAIVAMVNSPNGENSTTGSECPVYENNHTKPHINGDQFDWDSKQQGLILGSFFYGYIVTQIPGGFLAERYGGKWLYGMGTLCTAILTYLTPFAAKAGTGYFIAIRVLEGLGEGVTFPAMHAMIAKWIPLTERSKLITFINAGAQFGTIVSLPVSGLIAAKIDWESVFYVFGVLGFIWFFFWLFLVFDSPQTHPRISMEERFYIESNILKTTEGKLPFPPICQILSTPAFWALLLAHCGHNWGYYTLLTEIPTYLKNIQHFSLEDNGLMSALPYICMSGFSFIFSPIADWLVMKGHLSLGATRKLMHTISQVIPAYGLLGLAYVGCNQSMSIFWLCVCVGFNGAVYSGFFGNHMELSPNYAGTLMGFTNMAANITGFVAPYVVGTIINDNQTFEAWRTVFLLASGIYVNFNLFFVLAGSSKVQPWNSYWDRSTNY